MLYNYFKTAFRGLLKNSFLTVINISGLALGIACVFLIWQYVQWESGYDRFHEGAENIYRIAWVSSNSQTRTPHPMAQAMVADFPEVEQAVSLTPLWGPGLTRATFSIRNEAKDVQYEETGVLAVDSTFFKVFSFPLVKGNPATALKTVGGILLSERAAHKYFGDEEPMGKHLTVNDDETVLEVVGVFKDVPEQSHFHFDFLVSYVREKAMTDPGDKFFTWSDFGHYNYVRLKPGADAHALQAKLMGWLTKYVDWSPEDFRYLMENNFKLELQPLTDIHLHSDLRWELEANGNIDYVYSMIVAAVLILIIASINFINLTTAQSADRAKEIGIRKTLGAFRRQLIAQFTGESVLIALLSVILAVVMIELALPLLKSIAGQTLGAGRYAVLPVLLVMGVLIGVAAGLYPSFFLSAVKPTAVLKGKLLQGPRGTMLRNILTVFQFSASMILICASVVIYRQLESIRHQSLGFTQESVVVFPIKNRDALRGRYLELQDEIGKVPGVMSVSAVSNIPGKNFNQNSIAASAHPDDMIDASEMVMSYGAFTVLDVPVVQGRDFVKDITTDQRYDIVVNETAARNLNLANPVGQELIWYLDDRELRVTITGVVKDFNFQSLHQEVKPLVICLRTGGFNYVIAKVSTADFQQTIQGVESAWKKFDTRFGFVFFFLSDSINQQYWAEEQMGQVLMVFTAIAILIACFGLLGIAALTFRNRTKEISLRKVMGAGYGNLVFLLLRSFTRLILIAIIIAVPLAVWLMSHWLQHFAYRIDMEPLVFVLAGLALLVTAWGSLAYLTLRMAGVNPATTLKNE
jgi:putative ABC transport system permease protein